MKRIQKIFLMFLFVIILFSLGQRVQANSIRKISMDIYVDNNGDAYITEKWDCYTSQGTEVYHPYYNLGNSEIKDLKVSENGKEYTTISSWNTSGTLQSKAYKCGINKIKDGVELCWGISSYGSHIYTIKYTITNFVSQLTDSQMIYWTLIPYDFSNSIGDMYIKIHTDFNIEDTIDVWGYGNYGGTAYVYDGYIEMQSAEALATNEYMTILVKFPTGTFNCSNILNDNFDYYFQMAEEGATKYVDDDSYGFIDFFIEECLPVLIFILFFIIFALGWGNSVVHFDYGLKGKNISKNAEYFRDIPCNGNIYRAYYIGYKYGLVKEKTDLLGAIILKWLKDSLIKIEQKESGKLFKKEDVVVIFNKTDREKIEDKRERDLFDMFYSASIDGNLEGNEFERWCRRSYSRILNWFDGIILEQESMVLQEGLLEYKEKRTLGIFKNRKHVVTPEFERQAEELAGLKKYLLDYSLIAEREVMEVELFEEYLIYAQIMGIAKKVAKQFEDIYPEIIEQSSYENYDNIIFIHTCSNRAINSARGAKSEAEARASSYSSGGGGFSSGGGGGGSFGGGGGRRRILLK